MDTETGPPRPLIEHVIERLPGALKANIEIKKKTGKGALNNLTFGAAISAQTVEQMENGDLEIIQRLDLANKTLMMLDEANEQREKLGEIRVNEIINEVKGWWADEPQVSIVIDEVILGMKKEMIMQSRYSELGTMPTMEEYLDAVVPSNGIQLLAAAYATVSGEARFLDRQRFKDEAWNTNLEIRILADWMKHSKDTVIGHLDLFLVAANAYPGKSRGEIEELIRKYIRPTTTVPIHLEERTSRFLKEYRRNAAQFIGRATPVLHLLHPLGKHDPYRT